MNELKSEEQLRSSAFTRRALLLAGGKSLLLGALAARMYYLQVVESDKYRLLSDDNRINLRLLEPPRGRILDRFGLPLAVNEHNYRVLLVPEQVNDVDDTLARLGQIIELSESDLERVRRQVGRRRGFVPITVRENLTWTQVSQVEVNAPDLPGLSIDVGQTRSYPYSAMMSHIVGYVGAVSERELTGESLLELPGFRIGKTGVEHRHEEDLRGKAGNRHLEVNAVGRVMKELERQEGEPGKDVVLTVDADLQTFAHQRMVGERSAAAVVMDVHGGEILALVSVPSFDPMPFNVGLSSAQWQALINDHETPLSNKAISGTYAPGSTFKMVTALAALEEGIGGGHSVFCPGHMVLGNHRFHCWKRYGHGKMDMRQAIEQSCDVYFYDLAKRLGIDKMADMARRLGLGEPAGIDLPGERAGVMPTRAWKLANLGEPWQGGESLIAAIGQGFVLTTPLQLAAMTARIVNGGKAVVPHLTWGLADGQGIDRRLVPQAPDIGIDPAHLKIMQDAMDGVVNGKRGTARGSKIGVAGMEMGGKTGTSQVRRISKAERDAGVVKNEDLPWRRRDHALFVGFAPVEAPRYACAVVVEHGGGGSKAAAPIAKDLLLEVQRRDPAASDPMPLVARATRNT